MADMIRRSCNDRVVVRTVVITLPNCHVSRGIFGVSRMFRVYHWHVKANTHIRMEVIK